MRVATDVGGTFTDLVLCPIDPATGAPGVIRVIKVDTTPPAFADGVFEAMRRGGIRAENVSFLAHGSTVVINAITERKGAKTALITTAGFRDVLEIARGNRPDLFNFNYRKPPPFVERYLRLELPERTTFKGELRHPVDLTTLPELIAFLQAEKVEAIAICFLHSYANPVNEKTVADAIRSAWPGISVIASHEIGREWREYERTSTCVLSAYIHPTTRKYIDSLERRLVGDGLASPLFMMQSNGGIATVHATKANPITLIESGPASGIQAAAFLGKAINAPNLIVLDIGGTTAKCALIEGGEIKVTTAYHVERNRKSAGYPIQTPVCDIVEIGSGGGSIASVDAGGKLHVGPRSAGARPGPAAYGRGGTEATTTDANLVLGRIDADQFVGGEVQPDWKAMDRAFSPLMAKLGCSRAELARGIVRIANANMVNALRLVSTNKGHDPRDFTLMAFGGGGAMHAVALAAELRIPKVIIPANSSAFSAWGMLLSDLRRDFIITRITAVDEASGPLIASEFAKIEAEALRVHAADGAAADEPAFEGHADMRYAGQEHTVKVPVPRLGNESVYAGTLVEQFGLRHERMYGYRLPASVEIVNYHLVATAAVAKPGLPSRPATGRALGDALLRWREVDFDEGGVHVAAIYNGLHLEAGMTIEGPAVVQEPAATIVVPPGCRLGIDDIGNYHIDLPARAPGLGDGT